MSGWNILRSFPDIIWNWPPKQRAEERGRSPWLVDRFYKQGNLFIRLVLGGYKKSRSPYLPSRILKIYLETTTWFSHICCPDDLNTTSLSWGYVHVAASRSEETTGDAHSKAREGVRSLLLLAPSTSCYDLPMTSPITVIIKLCKSTFLLFSLPWFLTDLRPWSWSILNQNWLYYSTLTRNTFHHSCGHSKQWESHRSYSCCHYSQAVTIPKLSLVRGSDSHGTSGSELAGRYLFVVWTLN